MLDLRGDCRVTVGVVHGELPAHQINEGMKGHGATERQAVAFAPIGLPADSTPKLMEQARLADPSLADDEGYLSLPAPRPLERVEQLAQLALTSYERREPAVRLHLQAGPGLVCGHDLPGGNRLGFTLEMKRAEGARVEVAADEPVRALGDCHLSGFAHLL